MNFNHPTLYFIKRFFMVKGGVFNNKVYLSLLSQRQALSPEPDQSKRFRGNPGLREMPNKDSPPIMYFYLLFTVQLMKEIVRPNRPLAVKGDVNRPNRPAGSIKDLYTARQSLLQKKK
jgi:hypothetical protein